MEILSTSKKPVDFEFRDYQKQTLEILQEMDKKDRFSTLVNIPTGGGKTAIATNFCVEVLRRGSKVLWMADRISLLEQAIGAFKYVYDESEYSFQLICSSSETYSCDSVEDIDVNSNILFCGVGTLAGVSEKECEAFTRWIKESQDKENKLYIIYDEAHHIGANCACALFESLNGEMTDRRYPVDRFGLIGLTATVYRADKYLDVFHAWFKDGYDKGQKKFVSVDTKYGDYNAFEECVKVGMHNNRIALVDIKELLHSKEPVLVAPKLIKVEEYENGKPKKTSEMLYLADRIFKHHKGWGKTVVFVSNKKDADKLVELLETKGVASFSYISGDKSDDIFEAYKKNATEEKILVAVHRLDEGVDIPDLNTIYLYAPTQSHVLIRQRIGRVLRKPKDADKDARVIWQYYPAECPVLSSEEFDELLKSDFVEKEQSQQDMQDDIKAWKANNKLQLPAAMYLEPLPTDAISKAIPFSKAVLLNIIDFFGEELISEADSLGYYSEEGSADSSEFIYVRSQEKEGYDQLKRMLNSDWMTLLRFSKCSSFAEYAQLLDTTEEALLYDIKTICFYQPTAKASDTKAKRVKVRFYVRDEDIKKFCTWFFKSNVVYIWINNPDTLSVENMAAVAKKAQELMMKGYKGTELSELSTNAKELSALKQKLCEHYENSYNHSMERQRNLPKEYTDLLTYDDGKRIYQELQSLKEIMRIGAIDEPREKCGGSELAFTYFDENRVERQVPHLRRRTEAKFGEQDFLFIASALINVPNHISVSQADVDEYKSTLLDSLGVSKDDSNIKIVKEFLMALGYAKNEEILKSQCRLMKNNTPRLIQYMVYEKIYLELAEVVCFIKDDNVQAECVNREELQTECNKIQKEYRVSLPANLTPVEDVIYDYRLYLKAVPYYQGIKPEFLCRLVNDIVQLLPNASNIECVVDGFGGSGACTMNSFYKKLNPRRIYNDLGIMNGSFYKCLVKDIDGFANAIQAVIDEAFSDYDVNSTMSFFDDFVEYIKRRKERLEQNLKKEKDEKERKNIGESIKVCNNALDYLPKKLMDCEKAYIEDFDAKVIQYSSKDDANENSLRAISIGIRLSAIHEILLPIIDNQVRDFDACCRKVEMYMHVFMLKVKRVYEIMTDEFDNLETIGLTRQQVGLIFFFYNTLSHRHFYNDCTINLIGKFASQYRRRLEWGKKCFEQVEVRREDALSVLKDDSLNKASTVFYLDIPYAETSSADYVAQWFDTSAFIERLSSCKGTYIVSSRCNVCLPDEEKTEYKNKQPKIVIPEQDDEEVQAVPANKNDKLFAFYNSFVTEEYAKVYESDVSGYDEESWRHIREGNEAKYVFIPYTKMEEVFENGMKQIVGNATKIDENYVRRMLVATHFSNIPVEVMITNADLKLDTMPIQKLSNKMYVMPTFKTGIDANPYLVEPVVIIMKYEAYIDILLSLLFKDAWKKKVTEKDTEMSVSIFKSVLANLYK